MSNGRLIDIYETDLFWLLTFLSQYGELVSQNVQNNIIINLFVSGWVAKSNILLKLNFIAHYAVFYYYLVSFLPKVELALNN